MNKPAATPPIAAAALVLPHAVTSLRVATGEPRYKKPHYGPIIEQCRRDWIIFFES
jgi:hypothetical protein